jgi:phenylalanyl-tRNA synthetase beta chain
MTISYQWLQSLLPEKISTGELSEILTSIGLEVESVTPFGGVQGGLEGLVIGKILTAQKHENADKLQVCTVQVGTDQINTIVCGAPNAAAGQTVVVALPGATLYPTEGASFQIKLAKIRGIESSGMICAEDEIGLGKSHEGIIVINDTITPGTLAKDFYNIQEADFIFEIGLTPNRMDAMSHIGVAKDVCAYLANKNNRPCIQIIPQAILPAKGTTQIDIAIEIANPDLCRRYAGIAIANVKVKESPDWIQQKLKAIGLKPINNIVDITNYVLHECGQPLHAFDADKIVGKKIIVQTLADATPFVTLDLAERKLRADDIMICNAKLPICIAGVYGGAESGVSNDTKNIFLESAWFAPKSIRKTSTTHGLRTDAAIRFEKGVDISQTIYALQRAAALICELANGTIASEINDVFPNPITANEVVITYEYINRLSGGNYSEEKIKNILLHLCFSILSESEDGLTLQVPFAKPDISLPADIVEEIIRIDGLDNIPFTGKISYALGSPKQWGLAQAKQQVIQTLVAKGLYQIITNSITSSSFYPDDERAVKMLNSLSADLDTLRRDMLDSGLQVVAHNINRKNQNLQLFELGKTYANYNGKYVEEETLALYFTGNSKNASWVGAAENIDIYYVKGLLESTLEALGLSCDFVSKDDQLQLVLDKKNVGRLQKVAVEKLKQWDIKQDVYFVSIQWAALAQAMVQKRVHYKAISKFPAVKRDLALVLDKSVTFAAVNSSIAKTKQPLLKDVQIFDVFESEQLGKDKKSYAISLQLLDEEKTLTDDEIEGVLKKVVEQLGKDLGALVRG